MEEEVEEEDKMEEEVAAVELVPNWLGWEDPSIIK